MIFAFFLVKARYHWSQILGVLICIAGLGLVRSRELCDSFPLANPSLPSDRCQRPHYGQELPSQQPRSRRYPHGALLELHEALLVLTKLFRSSSGPLVTVSVRIFCLFLLWELH